MKNERKESIISSDGLHPLQQPDQLIRQLPSPPPPTSPSELLLSCQTLTISKYFCSIVNCLILYLSADLLLLLKQIIFCWPAGSFQIKATKMPDMKHCLFKVLVALKKYHHSEGLWLHSSVLTYLSGLQANVTPVLTALTNQSRDH